MFNMEFDDETLSQEFQAANCLFAELVDIGSDGAADQLFDGDVFTPTKEFSDDNQGTVQPALNDCPPPSVSIPMTPTKQTRRLKQHFQGSIGGRRPKSFSKSSRPTSRNAARERSRVKSLRSAFLRLQNSLPSVPPNTKLSKLDVLVLATTYIAHLMKTLDDSANIQTNENSIINIVDTSSTLSCSTSNNAATDSPQASSVGGSPTVDLRHHRLHEKGYLHPVRKWPMRSRLYAGAFGAEKRQSVFATAVTASAANTFATATTTTVLNLPPIETSLTNLMMNNGEGGDGGCSVFGIPPLEPSCIFDELFGFST